MSKATGLTPGGISAEAGAQCSTAESGFWPISDFHLGTFPSVDVAKLMFCPQLGHGGRKLQRGAYSQCFVILEEMKGFRHN